MTCDLLVLAENTFLETTRLSLRPLKLTDTEAMYEYASDQETTRFVFEQHQSIAETKETIATYFLSQPLGKYGIVLKATNRLIGTIDLRVASANRCGEIGYTLNKSDWNQGYATEAAQKLLQLAFEQLKLNRVEARHDNRNPASGQVMAKLGMTKEGVLREAVFFKGELATEVIYGITQAEYSKRQEK